MTQGDASTAARIDELEARIAHQDHSVHQLSGEIYQQQKQIAHLESMLQQLTNRTHVIEQAQSGNKPSDEVPPHY